MFRYLPLSTSIPRAHASPAAIAHGDATCKERAKDAATVASQPSQARGGYWTRLNMSSCMSCYATHNCLKNL